MHIKGYIKDIDSDCITITAPFKDYMSVIKQEITECEIRLDDGRRISADQRKKIYALLRDISEWSGLIKKQNPKTRDRPPASHYSE